MSYLPERACIVTLLPNLHRLLINPGIKSNTYRVVYVNDFMRNLSSVVDKFKYLWDARHITLKRNKTFISLKILTFHTTGIQELVRLPY
jgi:hypothetical protein